MTRKAAKLLTILGLLLVPFAAFGQTLQSFQVNGLAADYFGCDPNGNCPVFTLLANTSGTAGTRYFFYYEVYTFNGSQIVSYNGYGQIPNSSVSGNGQNQVTLSVDTSQVSGFVNTICTSDSITLSGSCVSGPGGIVNVGWQTNTYKQDASGSGTSTFPPNFKIIQNFHFTRTSANAVGTILGFAVPTGGDANLGSGHDGNVIVEHQ